MTAYSGIFTGTYRGTVDAAGRPHGRGDFDVTEGEYAGYAYSGGWDGGERAAGEAWRRWRDGDVYAGAMLRGRPHGRGVYHCAGAEGGRLEGEFVFGYAVGEGTLLLAGPAPREVWSVRMERWWVDPDDPRLYDGTHPGVRRLELLARVTEGGPPAPRREDGGRLPGPEWAATVERPDGAVVRVRCRSLAEVRAPGGDGGGVRAPGGAREGARNGRNG